MFRTYPLVVLRVILLAMAATDPHDLLGLWALMPPRYTPCPAPPLGIIAFYDYHLRTLIGPLRNPVPERLAQGGRFGAHHNPEDEYRHGRRADYRQKVPIQAAGSTPDKAFEDLFTALGTDRDRALVAFYVSSAARPSELVGLTNGMVDVGKQCISVTRKGSGAVQRIPASPEAFSWFRQYQEALPEELTRSGLSAWWTLRRPYRSLNYESARAVIRRVNVVLGANWTGGRRVAVVEGSTALFPHRVGAQRSRPPRHHDLARRI